MKRPYEPLDSVKQALAAIEKTGNPMELMTAENASSIWFTLETLSRNRLVTISVESAREIAVPARNRQIPLRCYAPFDKRLAHDGKLPIVFFIHGGGWTLGSAATYDSLCRALAQSIPALVTSVDYRLAPEHPFPAALQDVYLALHWVLRNADEIGGDLRRIAVAGDSAGGNLATVVARWAAREGISLALEVLLYPSTDLGRMDYPSYEEYGEGHLLTRNAVEKCRRFYVPNPADWTNPDVAPLRAPEDQLKLLPPTLIVTAGCDVLREEGIAYANRLRQCGVEVTHQMEERMIHGFFSFFNHGQFPDVSPHVEPIVASVAKEIRKRLA